MSKNVKFKFNPEKNIQLVQLRGISFEEVIAAIGSQKCLDIVNHPNESTYPNQKMYVLHLNNYIYLVPFVKDEEEIFLKTIFPSRKAFKHYLKRNET